MFGLGWAIIIYVCDWLSDHISTIHQLMFPHWPLLFLNELAQFLLG